MRTIGVVIAVVAVGIFIGIIATADYGDFVKERELRNLELSYYELQQKIKQCEELSGYSQDTCKEELKRFEASHEKMIQRYEGFTGLEVYQMAKDGKNSLLQSDEFWNTYEQQLQNCRETWITTLSNLLRRAERLRGLRDRRNNSEWYLLLPWN